MAVSVKGESLFKGFTIIEETFKTVDSHEIKAAILIPKNLKPGVHPLAYNVHGGFLSFGHALFEPFFHPWLVQLAEKEGAIIVSSDYRLLPTENGLPDILEDVEDAWQWTKKKLPDILKNKAPGHTIDFSRVLSVGGSAGGYCVLQLALSHPDEFRLLSLVYPLADLRDPLYVSGKESGQPNMLHTKDADIPSEEAALAWLEETRHAGIVSRAGFERAPYAIRLAQNGYQLSKVQDHKGLNLPEFYPLQRIEAGAKLPPKLWIFHGEKDTAVPVRGSYKLADLVKKKLPDVEVRLDVIPGQDHGFDADEKNWADYSDDILKYIVDSWVKQ